MTGPSAAVAAVRLAVSRELADLPAGSLVLVACSGGADSLALAAGMAFVVGRAARHADEAGGVPPLRAGAVVVDHGLQDGSATVATRAAEQCRRLGLDPVLVVPVTVDGPGGPEAAARDARYVALEEAARRTGAAAVLLGHTLDDQAETVLLGLARGSGARSLAGMPTRRGPFRRPLLQLRRADTAAACTAQRLAPWQDPTNAAAPDGPRRSRVRHQLLPAAERVLGRGVVPALARTAEQLREQADAVDELADRLLAEAASRGVPTVGWDADTLAAAVPGVRRAALHAAALRTGCPPGSVTRRHVLALDALLVDWHGQGPVHLPGGMVGVRECGRLVLTESPSPSRQE
ncbi:MAG: tRNA lysidine(34) synthetase TilS [Cellulomonas sp. 73-145]|uniref:tRNA lysidine(34) synthetase TilS n=1 Tax=Cellulomonas sp. 73-145 TaxID=1895739 RepID=UPI0009297932|nr:tRNA lysidine(34) synthetase TilS [Cellulomonas sp. 73-145]MBN9327139.1 tRNA lysidine(34) synthetase TilS [Cellulomonas sp.]OJV60063.1 MAG: tRNA lysidine(34) synthetase TilS [Cellulomonas sp. 73-145]